MNSSRFRSWCIATVLALAAVLPAAAQVQPFPSKPLRIVVPFPPGGPTDQVSRMLAQKLTESTGQPVVVDNRPGGAAQIAAAQLMQAPADGYTMMIGDIGALAINSTLYTTLSYEASRDFQAVTNVMAAPIVLIVPAKSPANSVAELLAIGKGPAGRVVYASQGIGTGGHLVGEMFKSKSSAKLDHVPYKGGAPAMQDLVGGQVDMLFEVMGAALPQQRGGRVKILAVAAPQRSPLTPDVPTMAEAGFPGVEMYVWFGMVVRSGTPDEIVRKLNAELVSALRSPDIVKRLTDVGFDPAPTSSDAFAQLMKDETARWGAVVKSSGARVD